MPTAPETYFLPPTPHVPNSRLPALVYRSVLTAPLSATSTIASVEPNHWLKGGVFKAVRTHHFHSVTHECYAVFRGESSLLLGRGPGDDVEMERGERSGEGAEGWMTRRVVVSLREGDVIVLPAGLSHCSLDPADGYEYVGFYPEGSLKWDNNWCKADVTETAEKAKVAKSVAIPEFDPIYGREGPLVEIWRKADDLAG
ncbi:hypothetical protein P152DRAFT_400874 [Eremomyces bilateralis CBS 781.70]|uniref:Cupin type-1 domain-containing protein n=1 Tax=Eremomyces bilateralis CBS 781.70 TaxID=1392243 RepID=A0A6G1FYG7_9PEZI|nr:uncharacterized protein P152DRAFT_400874 [Eremomyces bilateralis CBS 781.70]KAF1810716.1 hypothetical protein P152DRAFT_400874 [Eremomyces bilateralis CBS 781.70]